MRAIWTGAITFGLIHIPVKLYSGSESRSLNLDMIHEPDGCKVGYSYICKQTGKKIQYENIVKGYEYEKGQYVLLSKEDFAKADLEKTKSILVDQFVKAESIDPKFFVKPYFLEPEEKAQQVYSLLREALRKTKKVGIAQFVIRQKQHLGMLKPEKDIIVLEQMHYSYEIRKTNELKVPEKMKLDEKHLKLAIELINQLSGKFNPKKYRDTYVDELKRIVQEKSEGKEPEAIGQIPQATKLDNLLQSLEQSVRQIEKAKEGEIGETGYRNAL